ncbi:MAG: Molybdenum cofactor synthesis domain protein [Methanomicrobiales archaeon 53_19]|jgi:molybdopterin molybdotransferase|uniref:molybdopterin molybdotransferase MoeA n=1 Tax=Methanocalculus sp. TaxID=2004547 RepID=UPI000749F7AF|nr:gephyrin-like molybdotransferase Glp [Methanocalculus sp.]KUK69441.1 MAG: Molybdenum cofactor synthesis domain protein [Methanocalculus sp. 52_23]KUL03313.1 MAG: Molybdenum cofactor synthesis domain protein [Methanomicrobiales archaeon 53_19]HIJ07060.1 molybdopterin molybdotransferase MoeA [Methanocalculus sp.]
MSRFIRVIPVHEAVSRLLSIKHEPSEELVPLGEVLFRISNADIIAPHDMPGFARSIVDGYAVLSSDTIGAGESLPAMLTCTGRIEMGSAVPGSIVAGECRYVPTGGMMPEGADAVVMIEYTETAGDQVLVSRPASCGENYVAADEDFRSGEVILKSGHRILPQEMGVFAAAGILSLPVRRIPRIAVIATGNEIIAPDQVPLPGQVRDVNSIVCESFIRQCGCIPISLGIVPDEPDELTAAILEAVNQADAIFISGGSSKDDRDATARVIADLGCILAHGIAISPGKPTIIGEIRGKPVIGLPGHPSSAFMVMRAICAPLLQAMSGLTLPEQICSATLAAGIPSAKGREDYIRVKVRDGVATPLFSKSGLLHTLVESEGYVRVPAESEGFETGAAVEVILW